MTGHEKGDVNVPLVSIVVPVFNGEKYIREALNCAVSQTYKNIEVIVVDDCSVDHSLEVVEEFAKNDDRVKLVSLEKNAGVANARNIGINAANGDYIALLDSDDVWISEKLAMQVRLLEERKADIAYCSYGLIDEAGRVIGSPFIVPESTSYQSMLVSSVISCSTALIRADILPPSPFNEAVYHEDYLLWMQLLSCGAKAIGDARVLAYYRQVQGSRSDNKLIAARHRWDIYRNYLGLSIMESSAAILRYGVKGVVKYRSSLIGRHITR